MPDQLPQSPQPPRPPQSSQPPDRELRIVRCSNGAVESTFDVTHLGEHAVEVLLRTVEQNLEVSGYRVEDSAAPPADDPGGSDG